MLSSLMERLLKKDDTIGSYSEWYQKAKDYDRKKGLEEWREEENSDLYDNIEIRLRLNKIRALRARGDDHGLLFALNEGIHGNMGGMGNPKLYAKAKSGTKQLIIDYVDEIADALIHLANIDSSIISFEEKIDFLHRASHCFGRSALMLSGGGQLGNFHLGVLKALIEEDLLPNVVSGSSAGSIFAALVGTYPDGKLHDFVKEPNLRRELKKEVSLLQGTLKNREALTVKNLEGLIERLIPDYTFQEAYELTRRNINISIAPHEAHQKSRMMNAFASPNVLIRSAVMASCAIPGVFPPVTLHAKNKDGKVVPYLPNRKWVDGSMFNDLPSKRLTRLYGVNHFIVSLTNPFVIPFVSDHTRQGDTVAAIKRFSGAMIKEYTQLNYSISKKFFKFFPKLAIAANNINSVVQQDYTGDINIIADFSVVKPSNVLSILTYEELIRLVKSGERATWPKIEAIRTTTKVGRLLDEIIDLLDAHEAKLANRALKRRPRTKEVTT